MPTGVKGTDMPRKPNPKLIDQTAPEATDVWFAKARPAKDVLPGLMGDAAARDMLRPKRRGPPSMAPKEDLTPFPFPRSER